MRLSGELVEYCDEKEDETLRAKLLEWIKAWKIDPAHPSRALPPHAIREKFDPVEFFGPAPRPRSLAG